MTDETQTPERMVSRNEPCPCGSGKKYKRCHGVAAAPVLGTPKFGGNPMAGMGGLSGMDEMTAGAGNPMAGKGGLGGLGGLSGMMGMGGGAGASGLPFDPSQLDPQWMMQFSQAIQRLPKGQMQRLQALMQKAMAGRDITQEASEFERSLPVEFQSLMRSFKMPGMAGGMADGGMGGAMPDITQSASQMGATEADVPAPEMSASDAKKIIEAAVAEGKLSAEQAAELLKNADEMSASEATPVGEAQAGSGTHDTAESSKFSKFFKGFKK